MWGMKVVNVIAKCSWWTMALIFYNRWECSSHGQAMVKSSQQVAKQLAEMSPNSIKFEYKEGDVYFSSVTNQFNITQVFDLWHQCNENISEWNTGKWKCWVWDRLHLLKLTGHGSLLHIVYTEPTWTVPACCIHACDIITVHTAIFQPA